MAVYYNPHMEYYKYVFGGWSQPQITSNTSNSDFIITDPHLSNGTIDANHNMRWGTASVSRFGDIFKTMNSNTGDYWTVNNGNKIYSVFDITFNKAKKISKLEVVGNVIGSVSSSLTGAQIYSVDENGRTKRLASGTSANVNILTFPETIVKKVRICARPNTDGGTYPTRITKILLTGQSETSVIKATPSDYDFKKYSNGQLTDIYFGKKQVKQIYKGSDLVYDANPIPMTNPTVWLKNGEWSTSSWTDSSGLLRPTQTDVAKRPTIKENAINGYPSLVFNNQYFDTQRLVLTKAYSVIKYDNTWKIVDFNVGSKKSNYYPLGRGIVVSAIYGGVAGTNPDYTGSGGWVDVRDKVQGWVNGGSTSFGVNNGNFGDPWGGVVKSFRGAYWLYPNRYENWSTGENGSISMQPYLNCEIAEVILYNHSLSSTEQSKIMAHLKRKYKL